MGFFRRFATAALAVTGLGVALVAVPVDASATVIQPNYNMTPTTNDGTILTVGNLTYTVVNCSYSITANATVGSSSTVTGSTPCPSSIGLQLVANGTTGVTISGGANPFATETAAGAKGDVSLTILVQATPGLAISGINGSIVTTNVSGQGSAGESINVTGAGSVNVSTTTSSSGSVNFTPTTSGVTLTIDASAAGGPFASTSTLTSFTVSANVPEPASFLLVVLGLAGLAAVRRRRLAGFF